MHQSLNYLTPMKYYYTLKEKLLSQICIELGHLFIIFYFCIKIVSRNDY